EAKLMRRLLFVGGVMIAATSGDVSREEIVALETLLGPGAADHINVDAVRADLPLRIAAVKDRVPPLRRAQVVRDLCVIAGVDAPGSGSGSGSADAPTGTASKIDTIFVIPLENKADTAIYGNMTDAPYINGLFMTANHATKFQDELPSLDSEPHYIWMEAGTNVFADHTFSN